MQKKYDSKKDSHWHEFRVRSSHEARDGADFTLSASVEPLAEAAVRDAIRRDRIHHLVFHYTYNNDKGSINKVKVRCTS